MTLNLLDRRESLRQLFSCNNVNQSNKIDDDNLPSDLSSFYRNKLYYTIRRYCHAENFSHHLPKLIYEACVASGKLVETDSNRVKIGNLDDLEHVDSELLYKVYVRNHNYQIYMISGTFFMGVISHISMNSNFDQPKFVLVKHLSYSSQYNLYKNFAGLKKDGKILETLVNSLQRSQIQVLFTASPIPIFLSDLFSKASITCIGHVDLAELERLSQVTKSTIYESLLDACDDTIQGYMGKLLILGERRNKLIIAAECDHRMGLSLFTNSCLTDLLSKSLALTFSLFSEESFVKSLNGMLLPITDLPCIFAAAEANGPVEGPPPKGQLELTLFATRKLKLCGMESYTFLNNSNSDTIIPLKTWIREMLLNSITFTCPFDNSGCCGNLSEHILIFTNGFHSVEMSFVHNYKLLALSDSNFSTFIQHCCYDCGEITPNRLLDSNITLEDFLKTLLYSRIFTHKCKKKVPSTAKISGSFNNASPVYFANRYDLTSDLFMGGSKEIIFSLISDSSESAFPFRISFKLAPYEKYRFVPLMAEQCNGPAHSIDFKPIGISNYNMRAHYGSYLSYSCLDFVMEDSYIPLYLGDNIYLLYFQLYPEFNSLAQDSADRPSIGLIYSLHSYISNYISKRRIEKVNFWDLPCKCQILGLESNKSSVHIPVDKEIVEDWIASTGLFDSVHDYIKEIRDKKLIFSCESQIKTLCTSKCQKSGGKKSLIRACFNRGHCIGCAWLCFSSWKSFYIYNIMLIVHSLFVDLQVDVQVVCESLSELYICQIILSEFTLDWNEVCFLAKLALAKFFYKISPKFEYLIPSKDVLKGAKDLVKSTIPSIHIGASLSEDAKVEIITNINKAYDILDGLRIEELYPGVSIVAETPPETYKSDLGSVLAKFFSQTNDYYSENSIKWYSGNQFLLIYSNKRRRYMFGEPRKSFFPVNVKPLSFNEIFESPSTVHSTDTIHQGNKTFIIKNFYGYQFQQLRLSYNISLCQFIKSICKLERKHSTGGKSGAPLYVTHDRKYIVKMVNKYELECFVRNGLKLINYFAAERETLLCIPFGCLRITVLSPKTTLFNKTVKCVILQNVDFCNENCVHEYGEKFSFDLKGVGLHRSNSDKISSNGDPFRESSPNGLTNRSDNLSLFDIFDTIKIDATRDFFFKSVKTMRKIRSWESEVLTYRSEGYEEDEDRRDIVLWDRNFFEYTKGCPLELGSALPDLIRQIDKDTALLSELNVVDYSLLLHIYPETGLLCLGIIDYLRPYTWDKQVETIGKKLANITSGITPTVLSPPEYMKRFRLQVENLFSNRQMHKQAKLKLQFANMLSSGVSEINVQQKNSDEETSAPETSIKTARAQCGSALLLRGSTPPLNGDSLSATGPPGHPESEGRDYSLLRGAAGKAAFDKAISPLSNRTYFMDRNTSAQYREFISG